MYGLWTLQVVRQLGLGLLGLLPDLGPRHARLGQQFVVAGHGFRVARLLADPDRQRRAPVALARQGPVDVGLQEVAEAAVRMCSGSQLIWRLLASIRSLNSVVRMNQLLRGYWISGSSSARQQNGYSCRYCSW